MSVRIVPISEQPDLAALVAEWRVKAFFDRPGGYTVEEMAALILAPPIGPKETFVLFDGDRAVGTAGLMRSDLENRPDLTPWLGGLFVEPAFRGRGHATALVRQVEEFARAALVPVLWLYTLQAEGLYLRLGWQHAGVEQEDGHDVILMRRELSISLDNHKSEDRFGSNSAGLVRVGSGRSAPGLKGRSDRPCDTWQPPQQDSGHPARGKRDAEGCDTLH